MIILSEGAITTHVAVIIVVLHQQGLSGISLWRLTAVEGALVLLLQLRLRILENANTVLRCALVFPDFDGLLWLTESLVEHVLVIADQFHLALIFGVEMLLRGREIVFLVSESGGMAFLARLERCLRLIVLTQLVEVGSLSVA